MSHESLEGVFASRVGDDLALLADIPFVIAHTAKTLYLDIHKDDIRVGATPLRKLLLDASDIVLCLPIQCLGVVDVRLCNTNTLKGFRDHPTMQPRPAAQGLLKNVWPGLCKKPVKRVGHLFACCAAP